MNLKQLHGVDKFPAIYVTQSWRCVPGNGLRRAAPKLCSCLTMDGNSHLLCPWKHEGGAFITFSFICCHALSVPVIISITEPTAHVKYARAYPEKKQNKMRPWMMNNGKETFLNMVNTRSRFRCCWDWATISSRSCSIFGCKNTISLISVLTIWWCPCVEFSLVLLEEGV